MEKETRSAIEVATQKARRLLTEDFAEQLDGVFDVRPDGRAAEAPGSHLDAHQRRAWRKITAAIAHKRAAGMRPDEAVTDYLRDAAFTVLNRFVALKMLEARNLVQTCISQGEASSGFAEFCGLAPGVRTPDGSGYRLYLECIFDELSTEVKVLFDRRDAASALWPRRAAFAALLEIVNAPALAGVWGEDETIGWVYQYFNGQEERRAMRDASQAPRDGRELAVRNQFFTPRYVVEFLVDNTLGRLWFNWTGGNTSLRDRCQYLLVKPDETAEPANRLRDPRTIKLLDPACGSMHFGLYAFDLFTEIYREAWDWEQAHGAGCLDVEADGKLELISLTQTYANELAFLHDVPRLIIEHNIYGIDIDPRAAQIASLALWLRAQRAWHEGGVKAEIRPRIERGNVVAAVAPPAEVDLRQRFIEGLDPLDAKLFEKTLSLLKGLPELGVLLQVETELPRLIREVFRQHGSLFEDVDMQEWHGAEQRLRHALTEFATTARSTFQGRLFAQDALQGLRIIDVTREIMDVVVMNPPFGALAIGTKEHLIKAYPRSKNDLLAIFVERGLGLLRVGGRLGAITSRTCFFLSSFQKWREEVVLGAGRPEALADLGHGVMDDAMVEAAAYVLEKVR